MDEQNGSGFLVAGELANRKPFWPLAVIFLALACPMNFHFSTLNQIPNDGPLTRGFPLTFFYARQHSQERKGDS
jgi:hypothetical protein